MSLIVSNKLYKNNSKLGNIEDKLFLNVSKKIIAVITVIIKTKI